MLCLEFSVNERGVILLPIPPPVLPLSPPLNVAVHLLSLHIRLYRLSVARFVHYCKKANWMEELTIVQIVLSL